MAQLQLTPVEHDWSWTFAVVVLGGGLIFVMSSFLMAGSKPARGSITVVSRDYDGGRLMTAAAILFAGGLAGLAWKATILGGVPLFSGRIDVLRARAYGADGEIAVPAPSTFLTDGFYLALWCLLASAWAGWGHSGARRALIGAAITAAAIGSFSGASRNTLLFTVAVPLVAVYEARPRLSRPVIISILIGTLIAMATVSTVFIARAHQREAGRPTFLNRELDRVPQPFRGVVPLYLGGALPFESSRRLLRAVPSRYSYGGGEFSLQGLPDAVFPSGKSSYQDMVAGVTYHDPVSTPYWTVATYQGRAGADYGVPGIALISVLLGLLFGGAYRAARGGRGLFPIIVVAYGAYYAGFMFYDNLLSIAVLAVVYDLAVLAIVDRFAQRRAIEHVRTS